MKELAICTESCIIPTSEHGLCEWHLHVIADPAVKDARASLVEDEDNLPLGARFERVT